MADVNAQINIDINTAKAQSQLAALQSQIATLNKSMMAQQGQKGAFFSANATGQLKGLRGEIVQVETASQKLNKTLGGNNVPKVSKAFENLKTTMGKNGVATQLATRNVAALNSQYKLLGTSATGTATALKTLNTAQVATNQSQLMAQQKALMTTRALDQLGTATLNLGKNLQWAGRQLMVGFTVPLTIFGALAIKTFQDVERQIIDLQKVYGDFSTSAAETEKVTESIVKLSSELTKLGFTAKETLGLAADAAAIGFAGDDLSNVVTKATEMAALGMMTQAEALNTVISLNSAFGVSVDELGAELNVLNAIENQTVLSLQDMAEAIPITATVIKGLGGDVRDLSVFLTAMREGGINANEAANSLKTSLARLITPTKQAIKTAEQFGISLENLVAQNEGDVMGMIQNLAGAMESLSDLQKQQLMSDLFGKRQFARMGALLNNINKEGSQAAEAIKVLGMSAEDLQKNTDKELEVLETSSVMQLTAAFEDLKLAMAPIGEMFAKVITPVLESVANLLKRFDSLGDFWKVLAVGAAGFLGIIIPGVTMLTGLFLNLTGTLMNAVARIRAASQGVSYLATEELEAQVAADKLNTSTMNVNTSLQSQARILSSLNQQYAILAQRMSAVPRVAPGGVGGAPVQRRNAGGQILKLARGGRVGGSGNTDKVPALLTPGEFVINKKQSQKHAGFLSALNNGSVSGFNAGTSFPIGSSSINVPASMSRGQISELTAQIAALATAVQGNTAEEQALGTQIQQLVNFSADNARTRTGNENPSYDDMMGVRNTTKSGQKDVFSKRRGDVGMGILMPSAKRFQTDADALRTAGAGKDRVKQAKMLFKDDPLGLAQTIESSKPKIDAATQALVDEVVLGLREGSVEVAAAVDAIFDNASKSAANKMMGFGKKNPGRSEAAHVVDDYKATAAEVQAFSRGHHSQALVDKVGAENVRMQFMRDTVLDMPASVNQGLSGGGPMSGFAVKKAFSTMTARGEEGPGDTMRKQLLATRNEKGLPPAAQAAYDRETAEGLAAIDAAEKKFLAQIQALNDDAVVVEGTLDQAEEGVFSLNSIVDNEVMPSLRGVNDAMEEFLRRLAQAGSDMRLDVTPEGKSILDADKSVKRTGSGAYVIGDDRYDLGMQYTKGIRNDADVARMRAIMGGDDETYKSLGDRNYSNKAGKNFPMELFGGGQGKNNAKFKQIPELNALVTTINEGSMSLGRFNAELMKMPPELREASYAALEGTQAITYLEASADQAVLALQNMGAAGAMSASSLQAEYQRGDISMDAYIQGLRIASEQAVQVGRETGQNVDEGLRAFLGIASPSKLAMVRGREWIDGLVKAVKGGKGRVAAAGAETGAALDDGLESGIPGVKLHPKQSEEAKMPGTKGRGKFMSKIKEQGNMSGMIGGQIISSMGMMSSMFMDVESEMGSMLQKTSMFGGQLVSMASMFGPVAGGAAAAATGLFAVGSIVYGMWRDSMNAAAEEAYKLGGALGGAADAADKMSAVLGKATAAQRQALKGLDEDDTEKFKDFVTAFETEAGKALVTELKEAGETERRLLAEQYVAAAVANNQLQGDDVTSFARALGAELSNEAFGAGLARTMEEMVRRGTPSSVVAKSQAEERDKRITEAGALDDIESLRGYSTALGAAEQGVKAWTTVIATTREDYADGNITFNEYIKSMQEAAEAQEEYAEILFGLADASPDPRATKKARENRLLASGVEPEQIKARNEMLLSAGDTGRYGEGALRTLMTNPITATAYAGGENLFGSIFETINDVFVTGDYSAGDMFSKGNIFGAIDSAAEERTRIEQEGVAIADALTQFGYDFETASQLAVDIISNQDTAFVNAYKEATQGEASSRLSQSQAVDLATLMSNATAGSYGEGLASEGSDLRKQFDSLAKTYVRGGGTAGEIGSIVNGMEDESVSSFLNQADKLDGNATVKFVQAMDALSNSSGPKTLAAVQSTVADLASSGDDLSPFNEAVSELSSQLNGVDETTEKYIEIAMEFTENGNMTEEEALISVTEDLEKLNGMDRDYLFKIGVDITDPEGNLSTNSLGYNLYKDQLDKIDQGEEFVMSQPEWMQDLAAQSLIKYKNDDDNNFEVIEEDINDVAKMAAKLKEIQAEIGDDDIEIQKKASIDFILTASKMNGQEIDVAQAQQMVQNMIAESGLTEAEFYTMPEDQITKVINFQIIAKGADKAAQVFDAAANAAFAAGDTQLGASMKTQASAFRRMADSAEADSSSALTAGVSNVTTPSPTDGSGGGGGGKESNWLIDLENTFKDNEAALKRIDKLQKYNKSLSDEIILGLADDEEAFNKFMSEGAKGKQVSNKYFSNMSFDAARDTAASSRQKAREEEVKADKSINYFTQQQIIADEKLLQLYAKGGKFQTDAIEQARKRAEVETTILDRYERQVELQKERNSLYKSGLDVSILREEMKEEDKALENGKDRAQMNQENAEYAAKIKLLQLEQVKPIQDQIAAERSKIKMLEREFIINENNVKTLQDQADAQKRLVEDMQRSLEIRQREGEMLDHDLKLMGYAEEEINEAYDKRIEALDKTLDINQQIAQSQQDQLGLANALSTGDVSAAAAAAQTMQQNQMQNAADQFRSQLETARDSQIASLTGAESGMNREQIEERQRELEEDSYYTNLQIRDLEDQIYNLNMSIRNENDTIDGYKDSIEGHNKTIRDLEFNIFTIQEGEIKNLQKMIHDNDLRIAQADYMVTSAARDDKIQLARFERQEKMWEAETDFRINQGKLAEQLGVVLQSNNKQMRRSVQLANEYYKALSGGGGSALGIPELVTGNWESLAFKPSDLTSLTDVLDGRTASFNIPVTGAGTVGLNGIMGGSNTQMNNNVNINAPGASAEEIFSIFVQKLEIEKLRTIGGQ